MTPTPYPAIVYRLSLGGVGFNFVIVLVLTLAKLGRRSISTGFTCHLRSRSADSEFLDLPRDFIYDILTGVSVSTTAITPRNEQTTNWAEECLTFVGTIRGVGDVSQTAVNPPTSLVFTQFRAPLPRDVLLSSFCLNLQHLRDFNPIRGSQTPSEALDIGRQRSTPCTREAQGYLKTQGKSSFLPAHPLSFPEVYEAPCACMVPSGSNSGDV